MNDELQFSRRESRFSSRCWKDPGTRVRGRYERHGHELRLGNVSVRWLSLRSAMALAQQVQSLGSQARRIQSFACLLPP